MNGITLGDPKFVENEIRILISGTVDINSMDEFGEKLRPHLRPRNSLTLDFARATITGKGVLALLALQQANQTCRLKLVNVNPANRAAFENRRLGQLGLVVEYQTEVV